MSGRARDDRLEQFWREAVADWRRSGRTARAYCRRRGLQEASFYSWRRTLDERDAERAAVSQRPRQPKFVPVRVVVDTLVEIGLPTGLVVRVPVSTDATAVATLVAALRAASC